MLVCVCLRVSNRNDMVVHSTGCALELEVKLGASCGRFVEGRNAGSPISHIASRSHDVHKLRIVHDVECETSLLVSLGERLAVCHDDSFKLVLARHNRSLHLSCLGSAAESRHQHHIQKYSLHILPIMIFFAKI